MTKAMRSLAAAIALAITGTAAQSAAHAAPAGYDGDLGIGATVTGSVGGSGWFTNNAAQSDFWQFAGAAGQAVRLSGTPLDVRLDLAFSVYRGASTALAQFLNNSDWTPQGPDFLDFTFSSAAGQAVSLDRLVLPATDVYTVAIGGFFSQGAGPFGYRLSLTSVGSPAAVPLPSTGLLLAIAAVGAGWARRSLRQEQ